MLTFAQFIQMRNRTLAGPSGACNAFDNIPMGQRATYNYEAEKSQTPEVVFQKALKRNPGPQERMAFEDEDGVQWDMQWAYATHPKVMKPQ